jgi:hypothetical protein
MRTIRKLSFLGILAVAIAVLFLVGISFVQAQSKTQKGKPVKPPRNPDKEEVTWAVQIPGESVNLKGMYDDPLYVYANNNYDIIVSVEKKGWRAAGGGGASGIYYILLFKLVNPTTKYVEFSDVLLTPLYQSGENLCVFPGERGSNDPYCMEHFLNQYHPYSTLDSNSEDYDHVYIKFWIWGYDIEGMEKGDEYQPGDKYQLGSGDWTSSSNDRIRIKTGYTPVNTCFREEPAYHDIICQKYAEDGLEGLLNIWIEKLQDEKTWRIYVGQYNGGHASISVKETYCIEEKNKGWVSKTVTTLEATGNFSFMMDWIKNSQ